MVTYLNNLGTLFTAKFSVGPVRVVEMGWVEMDDSVERKSSASAHAELLWWGRGFSTPSVQRCYTVYSIYTICICVLELKIWREFLQMLYKHFYLYWFKEVY